MENLMLFKEFVSLYENKHKGKRMFPTTLYHKSNPMFREQIEKEGLKLMKGESYSLHSPEESSPLAIFAYFGDIDYYDSTYDDDIWQIDVSKIPNVEWFLDNEVGGMIQSAVVTYQNIPREAIKLIYKGTGKSM